MSLKPISIRDMEDQSGDIYESVVVMSKRAKQVLSDRIVEEIIESNDEDELGVYDELIETNPDDYEELVKPTTVSVNEFLDGEIDWKKNGLPKTKNLILGKNSNYFPFISCLFCCLWQERKGLSSLQVETHGHIHSHGHSHSHGHDHQHSHSHSHGRIPGGVFSCLLYTSPSPRD